MIGRSLQHFQILKKLGEGSMGEVYLALDTVLQREVAIKVVTEDQASDPHRIERFRAEALALASLSHPNIVTIHGVGEDQGKQFLAMERIEGHTLDKVLPAHGLSLQRFLALATPLADAVGTAHAHGITHRDLKPANLMVTPHGRLKVLDFGLAKPNRDSALLGHSDPPPNMATTSIKLSGTVPYMSPEQLQGEDIGPASDVFALGVILFEMAAGFRPFEGRSTLDLAVSILRDDPPSIGPRSALWPEQLEKIICRCLEKNPADRYPDGLALLADLKDLELAWLSGSLDAMQLNRPQRPAGQKLRRTVAGLAVAATLLLFAVGVAQRSLVPPQPSSTQQSSTQRPSRPLSNRPHTPGQDGRLSASRTAESVAVLPLRSLGTATDPYFAAGLTEEITSRLAGVPGLAVTSRTSANRFAENRPRIAEVGRQLGVDHVVVGTITWDLPTRPAKNKVRVQLLDVESETTLWSRTFEADLTDSLLAQSIIASEVSSELDLFLLPPQRRSRQRPTRDLEAYQAYLRGLFFQHRSSEIRQALELALPLFSRAVELDPSFALAYGELAKAHAHLAYLGHGTTRDHRQEARRALLLARQLDPPAIEVRLATGYLDVWLDSDVEKAFDAFHHLAEKTPEEPAVLQALAWVERRRGHLREGLMALDGTPASEPLPPKIYLEKSQILTALEHYQLAFTTLDQARGHNPDDPFPLLLQAELHWLADSDLTASRRILESSPALLEHPYAAWCWFWQDVYERRYGEALDRLDQLSGDTLQWDDFYYPVSLLEAEVHGWANRQQLARPAHQKALEHLQAALVYHPEDPRLHGALGVVWSALGRHDLAVSAGLRAIELEPPNLPGALGTSRVLEIAWIYTRSGRSSEAITELATLLEAPSLISRHTLKLDPRWQDLRLIPEFESLLELPSGAEAGVPKTH